MHLENFNKIKLTGKIHTVEVVSRYIDKEQCSSLKCHTGVTYCTQKIDADSGELITKFRFNPEIYNSGKVENLELFYKLLNQLMYDIGVGNDFIINRLDFALDNCNGEFDEYAKLNRLLLSLLSISKNMQNRYESKDFIKLTNLNIKVTNKSRSFEVEAYNKQIEVERQGKKSPVKCRLEFRKSQLHRYHYDTDVFSGTVNEWLSDLRRAISTETILALEDIVNDTLIRHYCNTRSQYGGKRAENGSIRNINLFIQSHQQYIYSKRQLVKLYELLEVTEPRKHADNFKRNYRIEFISIKDIKRYIKIINDTVNEYKGDFDYTLM